MEREVGGGIGMGNTCKSTADSFKKKKFINLNEKNFKSHELWFVFLAYVLTLSLPRGRGWKPHELKQNIFEKDKYLRRIAANLQMFIGLCRFNR